jgi:hypothetical protein
MYKTTAPDGIATDGLVLGTTPMVSGTTQATNAYQAISFNRSLFPVGFEDAAVPFIRVKCATQVLSVQQAANGDSNNVGDTTHELDTWHRFPLNEGSRLKVAAAAAIEYILELAK